MPHIINKADVPMIERPNTPDVFKWLTTPRLANTFGCKHMQVDIRSLSPGKLSFPYHFHRASEELFYIISGEATLRTPQGFRTLHTGDIVFFEMGETSAHQVYNHTDTPCVYLDIRTTVGIDVVEYPDSGKINILPYMELYHAANKAEYFDGEDNPLKGWEDFFKQHTNIK